MWIQFTFPRPGAMRHRNSHLLDEMMRHHPESPLERTRLVADYHNRVPWPNRKPPSPAMVTAHVYYLTACLQSTVTPHQPGRRKKTNNNNNKTREHQCGSSSLAHIGVVERPTAYMDAMERNETNDFRPWLGRIKGRVIAHENMLRGTKRLTNS
jgi:hypothetical protein